MKSGTEKKPNPHEVPLGKYLRTLARPMSFAEATKYVQLVNGQIVRRLK
jgi:hypothetical protein